jgi:hypothetical protein
MIKLSDRYPEGAIVKVLLADSRVNPFATSNSAIYRACRNWHLEVINVLLEDSRVDFTGWANEAMRFGR